MGRHERPLDADAGPLAGFAADLRRLRQLAGGPSYRQLSKSANYSATALSQAASGESLPTLTVTLAYVRACGGDTQAWERSWRELAATLTCGAENNRPVPPPRPTAPSAASPANAKPARRASRRSRWPLFGTAAALTVLALILASSRTVRAGDPAQPRVDRQSPTLADGADPKVAGCGDDAIILDTVALVLPEPIRSSTAALPAGTRVGIVQLRYSPHCAAAWSKLIPAAPIDDPTLGTVSVEAERPADGASVDFHLGHIEQAYSDLLLTGSSCILARGTLILNYHKPITAATKCLSAP